MSHTAAELGTAEPRVAASSVQYEPAERLWTVTIAVWSQHGLVLDVSRLRVGPISDGLLWGNAATLALRSVSAARTYGDCPLLASRR